MHLIFPDRAAAEKVCAHLAVLPDSGVLLWSDVDAVAADNVVTFAEAEDGRLALVPLAATEADEDYLAEYLVGQPVEIRSEWPVDWVAKSGE